MEIPLSLCVLSPDEHRAHTVHKLPIPPQHDITIIFCATVGVTLFQIHNNSCQCVIYHAELNWRACVCMWGGAEKRGGWGCCWGAHSNWNARCILVWRAKRAVELQLGGSSTTVPVAHRRGSKRCLVPKGSLSRRSTGKNNCGFLSQVRLVPSESSVLSLRSPQGSFVPDRRAQPFIRPESQESHPANVDSMVRFLRVRENVSSLELNVAWRREGCSGWDEACRDPAACLGSVRRLRRLLDARVPHNSASQSHKLGVREC